MELLKKADLVLDATELAYGLRKAEKLPPRLRREFHPRQLVPADRTRRSRRLSAQYALRAAGGCGLRRPGEAAIRRGGPGALDDRSEAMNDPQRGLVGDLEP